MLIEQNMKSVTMAGFTVLIGSNSEQIQAGDWQLLPGGYP